jgi:dihydroxy-acid dehydratase
MMMAMTRLNVPSAFLNGGPAIAGKWQGNDVEIKTVAEYTGKFFAKQTDADILESVSRAAYPAAGCCAGQFTASTMAMIAEVLGFAPLGATSMPAVFSQRKAIARATGRRLMTMVKDNYPLPRDLVTRKSLENACAAVAATGGSTNAALHIPAIANEAGIDFDIDDVAKVFKRTPLIAHLSPSGPYLYPDLHAVGGVPVVLKVLLDGGFLHGDCLTLSGQTLSEALADVPAPDGKVVTTLANARSMEGGLTILRGNLAPDGAIIKAAGLSVRKFSGPARIFENEEACLQALMANDINDGEAIVIRNEGPKGGPGMREMVSVTALLYGMGKGETTALITDGRFSGASYGFCIGYITPEAACDGPIAYLEAGDIIDIDVDRGSIDHRLDEPTLRARMARGRPSDPSGKDIIARTGVAQKYVACVGPATKGAVTHSGNTHWKHEITGE